MSDTEDVYMCEDDEDYGLVSKIIKGNQYKYFFDVDTLSL